jgi:hypothetical protein
MYTIGEKVLASLPSGMPTGEVTILATAKNEFGGVFYQLASSAGNIINPWIAAEFVFKPIEDKRITLREDELRDFMESVPRSIARQLHQTRKGDKYSITLELTNE